MLIQVAAAWSWLRIPMIVFSMAWPVRRVSKAGWVSPGKGLPSSWIARQPGSREVRPCICARLRPRMRSAAGLALRIRACASWNTIPCGAASKSTRSRSRAAAADPSGSNPVR